MTDAEKCRMIVELEYGADYFKDIPEATIRASLPDFAHDLNLTMRAARKLPYDARLATDSQGWAQIKLYGDRPLPSQHYENDPARAAFEALSSYLITHKETQS